MGIVKQLEWEDSCQHQTPICKQIGIVKQLEWENSYQHQLACKFVDKEKSQDSSN